MSNKGILAFGGVIVVLVGMLLYLNFSSRFQSGPAAQPPAPEPKFVESVIANAWPDILKNAAAPPLGNPKAKWTVVEIGDFQCPNCGNAKPLVENSVLNSDGAAKLYFINYPLTKAHPHAMVAAEAGEAAAAQGKFWPMYDMLYGHQDMLIDSEIQYNAGLIPGLDANRLAREVAANKYAKQIAAQVALLDKIGVVSVPTLLVRSPTGKIGWYVGTLGSKHLLGIGAFAAQCPWGGGIGVEAVKSMLQQDQQNAEMGTGG
jgi:hypothetical protein